MAGFSARAEPCNQFPASHLRPDIKVYNWANGRHAMLDVTIVDQMQTGILEKTKSNPKHILRVAEDYKKRKYHTACSEQNTVFIPLAFTAFGGFSPASNSFLTEVAQHLATITQRPYSRIVSEIRHHISTIIWSANSETLLCGPNHSYLVYNND